MTKVTKGFAIRMSGKALTNLFRERFDLPEDAFLFKIVPSRGADYAFDVLLVTPEGFEIAEGDNFPLVMNGKDLPGGEDKLKEDLAAKKPDGGMEKEDSEVKEGPEDVPE